VIYTRVTAPGETPVSLAEAKVHLRVDSNDENDLITSLIEAATGHLDGRAGILGRPIVTQSWRLDTLGPVGGRVMIGIADVQSVTSVKYLVSGSELTWSSAEYRLGRAGLSSWFVEAKDGYSFPAADDQEDAFRVTFVAGFGASEDVPAPIKQAILLLVGHWYANREALANSTMTELPLAVAALTAPFRRVAL